MTAIGVCGYGRCGSTMVMEMLRAGGIEPVDGSDPRSHELPTLERVTLDPAAFDGRAIKLLDAIKYREILPGDWSFIWIDRQPHQQARSAGKFMAATMGITVTKADLVRLERSYGRDRLDLLRRYRRLGKVTPLRYERVLCNPMAAAKRLARVAGPTFDIDAASKVVHVRSPLCAPSLTFETTGVAS